MVHFGGDWWFSLLNSILAWFWYSPTFLLDFEGEIKTGIKSCRNRSGKQYKQLPLRL